jgi:hypothetical protein
LIHCREGADRTGVASVMARMAVGGKTYDRSREQLDIRFLHMDDDAGHIGGVLEEYEQYCRQSGTGTGGWREFRDWVFSVYQPSYAYVRIDVPGHLAAGSGQAVAVAARIVNLSTRAIPAGSGQKPLALVAFSGEPFRGEVAREFSAHVPLPKADIPPGGRAAVDITLTAPRQPGHYLVHFDVLEDGAAYFSESGSPLPDCDLEVAEAARGNCGLRIVDCGFTAKEAWPAADSLSFNPQFDSQSAITRWAASCLARRPPDAVRGCARSSWQGFSWCHPERSRGVSPCQRQHGNGHSEIPRLASLARNDNVFCVPGTSGAPPYLFRGNLLPRGAAVVLHSTGPSIGGRGGWFLHRP